MAGAVEAAASLSAAACMGVVLGGLGPEVSRGLRSHQRQTKNEYAQQRRKKGGGGVFAAIVGCNLFFQTEQLPYLSTENELENMNCLIE